MPDMPTATHLQALISARLGSDLTAYVTDRRCFCSCGKQHSWRTIAADIRRDSKMNVSHETLRAWFATSDAA